MRAERIERGEDDRARRVVDDQLDAGGLFERADVAPLAADDAPLHVVAREIDDRHGRLDRGVGGAALDGVGDDVLRAGGGGFAGFRLETLDEVGGVAPRVRFDLFQEQLARLVGGEARDALQLALAVGENLLAADGRGVGARLGVGGRGMARPQVALERLGGRQAVGECARLVGQALIEAGDLLLARPRLRVGVRDEGVRAFARFEQRFLLEGFGFAARLLPHVGGVLFGAPDDLGREALAARDPPQDAGERRHPDNRAGQGEVHGGRGTHRVTFLYGRGRPFAASLLTATSRRVVRERKDPALPCGEVV